MKYEVVFRTVVDAECAEDAAVASRALIAIPHYRPIRNRPLHPNHPRYKDGEEAEDVRTAPVLDHGTNRTQ